MSKWKIPFIANIPIEQTMKMDEQVKTEMIYEKEKTKKIAISFNNLKSGLRRIADYLWVHLNQEISYQIISEDLGIPQSSIRIHIAELNFYKGFPITMIPIRKKVGFIQSVLDSDEDYERWDRIKMKTITSMSTVKDKAEKITSSKRRVRQKQKVMVKVQNEN